MGFHRQIQQALHDLERAGLRRAPREVSGPQGPEIVVDGRSVLCFCSNNYLGFADDPRLAEAARLGAQEDGTGAGASRLITGTMRVHREAERAFARALGTEDAVLFSSGYAANVGTIQALLEPGDAVFSDALNHASIIDGCRLSRASVHVYRHRDMEHLEGLLYRHRKTARRALIASDSLFSMDGVVAPLPELAELTRAFDAGLLIDEAHALGVLGPSGLGACAAHDVHPDVLIGTLGKSFGAAGAFVATTAEIASYVRNRARSFVFSTAPPPAVVHAAVAALPLVMEADERRRILLTHSVRLRQSLRSLGYDVPDGESQILPVLIGENPRTMELSAKLLNAGVFVQGIRPPTVPAGTARLRLTPMATHRTEHIDFVIDAFASVASDR